MNQASAVATTRPTFRLTRPSTQDMQDIANTDRGVPFNYPAVGSTKTGGPSGWRTDFLEGQVGSGPEAWTRAKAAIDTWTMFDLNWVHLLDRHTPLEPGQTITFSSYQLGVWIVNSCRIVYVVDEVSEAEERYGFAYGTLPSHAVAGEELFLARWDRRTDRVFFGVRKFSRARHPLVRLSGPIGRAIQRRFSRNALDRIERAIQAQP